MSPDHYAFSRSRLPDHDKHIDNTDATMEQWKVQVEGKLEADAAIYYRLELRKGYGMSRVAGDAFKHLEPRKRLYAKRQRTDANEVMAYLCRIYRDPHRVANAEKNFCTLRMDNRDCNTFWAEFQGLTIELDRNDKTLISVLTHKLSYEMQ